MSTFFRNRTGFTFFRPRSARRGSMTEKPPPSGSMGASLAMGVSRSQTMIVSPPLTSLRKALNFAFSSETLALFMTLS